MNEIWDKITVFHWNVKTGIKNLIRWFPTIWKDRDYDDYFIFVILKKKLEFQADYIGGKDRHVGAQRDAERMRLCARLIEKLQTEFYIMEYMDYYDTDIELAPIDGSDGRYEMEMIVKKDDLQTYFDLYPNTYRLAVEGKGPWKANNKPVSIATSMGMIRHNKAKRLLFTILEEHMESWWD